MKRDNLSTVRTGRQFAGTRQGFSLIEILVVLVVLLIGILAVLRLFPGGFLTVQRTGELTNGQSLAQQQMDQQKNLLSVSESIIGLVPDGSGNLVPDSTIRPDDLRDFTANELFGIDPYYYSNVNRLRRVIGETFRIPVPNSNAVGGVGSLYMLQLGPVVNSAQDGVQIYGAPLERTEQLSVPTYDRPDPTPILNNEAQYAIDYVNRKIAFYPRVKAGGGSRAFVITYEYYVDPAGNGGKISVRSPAPAATTFRVPDVNPASLRGETAKPVWYALFQDEGGNNPDLLPKPIDFWNDPRGGVLRGSEDVSRKFVQKPVAAWTDDPYEYDWYGPGWPRNAHVGILSFNPNGHNHLEVTSTGLRPLTARVDYSIFDNHILREDRSMPDREPYLVKLSVPFVLVSGDLLQDQSKYIGIFGDASPDLLCYNANTGEKISQLADGVSSGDLAMTLDSRTGVVRFSSNVKDISQFRSASLRLFYRTQKEWGMQVQKASAHYVPTRTAAAVDYRSYYVGGSSAADGGQPTRIYFAPCDAGKTVVLGQYHAVDSQSKVHRFTNEAYLINDNAALFENLNGTELTWIDIKQQHSEAGTEGWKWDPAQTGFAVRNVQGGSLKSRVVWRSSDRWRKVDNDTFLTPPPGR